MRIADLIAQTPAAHGIRHAFGMPGGEVVTLIDALERAGIRFVLARNETAAAMMAALPTLLVYVLAGRYFVRGLMAGAVKG
jgi:acetolactate synthase-1/2/3 large subunit